MARYNGRMLTTAAPSYKGNRFPLDIIAHAVWLYFRCALSYRQVEEILVAQGYCQLNPKLAAPRGPSGEQKPVSAPQLTGCRAKSGQKPTQVGRLLAPIH